MADGTAVSSCLPDHGLSDLSECDRLIHFHLPSASAAGGFFLPPASVFFPVSFRKVYLCILSDSYCRVLAAFALFPLVLSADSFDRCCNMLPALSGRFFPPVIVSVVLWTAVVSVSVRTIVIVLSPDDGIISLPADSDHCFCHSAVCFPFLSPRT